MNLVYCTKASPKKTLNMKGEKCSSGKHSKVRLTDRAATSATGEKLPMFVKTEVFQAKSWMDSFLFDEWVKEFEGQNRKVALIVDNCPAHPSIEGLKAVEVILLPPNTTSKTQPMEQQLKQGIFNKEVAGKFNNPANTSATRTKNKDNCLMDGFMHLRVVTIFPSKKHLKNQSV